MSKEARHIFARARVTVYPLCVYAAATTAMYDYISTLVGRKGARKKINISCGPRFGHKLPFAEHMPSTYFAGEINKKEKKRKNVNIRRITVRVYARFRLFHP